MTKEKMELILKTEGKYYSEIYMGYKVEIIRHPTLLHLNGYVTFPSGNISSKCISSLLCHGGITYEEDIKRGKVIGFDTAHYEDLCPMYFFTPLGRAFKINNNKEYKDMKFCIAECRDIIDQVKTYNKRERQKREKIRNGVKQLEEAMEQICVTWESLEDTEFVDENYPFDKSFEEVLIRVSEWKHSIEEKLGV